MATHFDPPGVWQPFGAFSMAAMPGERQLVFLKGQVALDTEGQLVGAGDMRAQVRQTIENIEMVLASLGGRMADTVSLTQHTTDIEAFMACGDIRQEFFSAPYPVTTTVEVSRLYRPDILVEITAIAEVPRDRYRPPA